MKHTIVWSDFASKRLDDIYSYYEKKSMSSEVAKRLIRKIKYRYLVESNYKIIYAVNETHKQIRIYDVFDTRRNPIKMSDSLP